MIEVSTERRTENFCYNALCAFIYFSVVFWLIPRSAEKYKIFFLSIYPTFLSHTAECCHTLPVKGRNLILGKEMNFAEGSLAWPYIYIVIWLSYTNALLCGQWCCSHWCCIIKSVMCIVSIYYIFDTIWLNLKSPRLLNFLSSSYTVNHFF